MILEYYGDGWWAVPEPYHRRDEVLVWREPWPFGWMPPAPARARHPDTPEDLPMAHPLLRVTVHVRKARP